MTNLLVQPIAYLYRDDIGAACGANFKKAMPGLLGERQDPFHLINRVSRDLDDSHPSKGMQPFTLSNMLLLLLGILPCMQGLGGLGLRYAVNVQRLLTQAAFPIACNHLRLLQSFHSTALTLLTHCKSFSLACCVKAICVSCWILR